MHFLLILTLFSSTTSFKAQKLYYYPGKNRVVLVDSAIVNKGTTTLMADSIVYEVQKKLLLAFKGVVLIVENDTLLGDSLFYSLKTHQGVSFHGESHVEKGFLRGEKMYKVTDSILHIENGTFTSCDLDTPHYYFYSKEMKIIRGNMAIVSPLVLFIHEVPVIYIPFWFFPVKKGRKSGFLTPHFGYNSSLGKYFRNVSYYWVLSNYADVTFTLNLTEKRGIQAGVNFVYKKYRVFDGNLDFTLAQEFLPVKRRWSLRGFHIQNLPYGFKARMRLNFVSDKTYIEDYSETPAEWLKREMTSFLNISKSWKFANMSLLLIDTRNLDTRKLTSTLPDFKINIFNISYGPLSGSSDFRYLRISTGIIDSVETRSVANSNIRMRLPFHVFRYFNINPSLFIRSTLYDRDREGNPNYLTFVYSTSLKVSTTIYGYSRFGFGPFKRFRHTMRPGISFNYTPEKDQGRIDPVDGYGVIKARKNGSISISNDFDAKLRNGKVVNLLSVSSRVSYDFLKDEKKLGAVGLSFSVLPTLPVKLTGYLTVDPYKKLINYRSYRLSATRKFSLTWEGDTTDRRTYSIYAIYNYSRALGQKAVSRLDLKLTGNLTKNWKVRYSLNIDPAKFKIYDQSLGLERDLHCWKMDLNWWKRADGVWSYDFKIWIKNLPDVKFKKSFFDLFLPH